MSVRVTSPRNRLVQHAVRLQRSAAYRAETASCILRGRSAVVDLLRQPQEGLRQGSFRGVKRLWIPPDVADMQVSDAFRSLGLADEIECDEVVAVASKQAHSRVAGVQSPAIDDCVAEIRVQPIPTMCMNELLQFPPWLLLDNVADPGNVGTILRTAFALGIGIVGMTPGTADPFSPKVLASSRGASLLLPLVYVSSFEAGAMPAESVSFLATTGDGTARNAGDKENDAAVRDILQSCGGRYGLVLGNEGHGLSDTVCQWAREATHSVPWTVPLACDNRVAESLNVAAAGAILMFHAKCLAE